MRAGCAYACRCWPSHADCASNVVIFQSPGKRSRRRLARGVFPRQPKRSLSRSRLLPGVLANTPVARCHAQASTAATRRLQSSTRSAPIRCWRRRTVGWRFSNERAGGSRYGPVDPAQWGWVAARNRCGRVTTNPLEGWSPPRLRRPRGRAFPVMIRREARLQGAEY